MLTVTADAGRGNDGQVLWECLCDCGNKSIVRTVDLKNTKSCGCLKHKYKDHTGEKVGKLTVLNFDHIDMQAYWKCKCECGNEIVVRGSSLTNGRVFSCGCENSKNNALIYKILQENNINFQREFLFDDCKFKERLPFDFAIFDSDNNFLCVIEFQGRQHFTEGNFGKKQREITDPIKFDYCKNKKINLHYINYDEDVEEKLKEILGTYSISIQLFEEDN